MPYQVAAQKHVWTPASFENWERLGLTLHTRQALQIEGNQSLRQHPRKRVDYRMQGGGRSQAVEGGGDI